MSAKKENGGRPLSMIGKLGPEKEAGYGRDDSYGGRRGRDSQSTGVGRKVRAGVAEGLGALK